ncbi:hypothetical protein [Campylobacter insulaenigrae]|uniref:hypothetical protein n=1 Tax=Campylobacter insulaenigrae TaxID=260714 RepID=UPI002153A0CC|nr:hypothetical protein [Campylobacter insulaenigrae]MCR6574443.1 hypothetical protein [Campylobacter insulaenigrae]
MNKILSISVCFLGVFLLNACAIKKSNQDLNTSELKSLIKEPLEQPHNKNQLIKELLINSPSYAQKNQQKAVKENIVKLPNNMPLYRQPLFAQMIVFPYVGDNGIYHGYSENWVKIKEGEFVLSDPKKDNENEKIFDFNEISN